jgi:uncharacterized protein with von Willebrand factor type A (vWA) domain
MLGPPEEAAKALVLAVARQALPAGRPMHLVLFGGRGAVEDVTLRRGRAGLEQLLDFLGLAFYGGTDFDGPLNRALSLLEQRRFADADILLVTDGLCRASGEMVERVRRQRAAGLRVLSAVIVSAAGGDEGGVAALSDELWRVDVDRLAEGAAHILRWSSGTGPG